MSNKSAVLSLAEAFGVDVSAFDGNTTEEAIRYFGEHYTPPTPQGGFEPLLLNVSGTGTSVTVSKNYATINDTVKNGGLILVAYGTGTTAYKPAFYTKAGTSTIPSVEVGFVVYADDTKVRIRILRMTQSGTKEISDEKTITLT